MRGICMSKIVTNRRKLGHLILLIILSIYSNSASCQVLQEVSVDRFFEKGSTWEETLLNSREKMFNSLDNSHVKESATNIVSTGDKIDIVDKNPEYRVLRNQWTSFWRKFMADYPEVRCGSLFSSLSEIAGCPESNDKYATFYIAQNGNDKNKGSKAKPFKTFDRARLAVRQLIRQGLKAPVRVIIREGKYHFAEPFKLGLKDSGTKTCPISWEAAPNEKVILRVLLPF